MNPNADWLRQLLPEVDERRIDLLADHIGRLRDCAEVQRRRHEEARDLIKGVAHQLTQWGKT